MDWSLRENNLAILESSKKTLSSKFSLSQLLNRQLIHVENYMTSGTQLYPVGQLP